jgi:hypothetical protein
MPKYHIDLAELKKFIEDLPEVENDLNDRMLFEMEDHEGAYIDPLNCLHETGFPHNPEDDKLLPADYEPPPEHYADFIGKNGVYFIEHDSEGNPTVLEYDPEAAKAIRKVASEIWHDDGDNGPAWQRFIGKHGGDDYQDYFGSHILAQLDMFDRFLEFKYGVKVEND